MYKHIISTIHFTNYLKKISNTSRTHSYEVTPLIQFEQKLSMSAGSRC